MHSTKTLLIVAVLIGALMFVAGHALWDGGSVDNSEATPSPTVSVSPTDSPAAAARSPMSYSIRLSASGPVPATLVIRAGDTVSLIGDDAQGFWPKSGDCPGLDAMRALGAGERYTVTFSERRTCSYYDNRQPALADRQGTIIVQ